MLLDLRGSRVAANLSARPISSCPCHHGAMGPKRVTKKLWPKRIADELGIAAKIGSDGPWCSTGDTTDVMWFHAMCNRLGIQYPGERVRAMNAIFDACQIRWDARSMASNSDGKVGGGNVTVAAFEALWDNLDRVEDRAFAGHTQAIVDSGTTTAELWDRELVLALRRRGQSKFRRQILLAYDFRCAVTGSDAVQVLEAAHIHPHAAGGPMETSNGLLLRADIHLLFDMGLWSVDTATHPWRVDLSPDLRSSNFSVLHRTALALPSRAVDRPSAAALSEHRVHWLGAQDWPN